jgi:hypothetical protein
MRRPEGAMSLSLASLFGRIPLRGPARAAAVAVALLLASGASASAQTQPPVKGEVTLTQQSGFTRLAFHFDEEVGIKIAESSGILIVSFSKPVNIQVEQLAGQAQDLIRAARRDPDGNAVRIALSHKMKLHSIPAAERYFLDLLPESWSGVLPGLPQDVVDELARRAREAERLLRARNGEDRTKQIVPARVKAAVQPTFTRFLFELPEAVGVNAERNDDALTLRFDRRIQWDIADVRAVLPPGVSALDTEIEAETSRVTFALNGRVQLRTFREERAFVVDVDLMKAPKQAAVPPPVTAPVAQLSEPAAPAIAAPQTVPADKPLDQAAGEPQPQPVAAHEPPQAEPAPLPEAHPPVAQESAPAPEPMPVVEATPAPLPAADPKAPVSARVQRLKDGIVVNFQFAGPTPAAIFRHNDVVWIVFESAAPLNVAALNADAPGIRKSTLVRSGDGVTALRLKLERPRLVGAAADGATWSVTIADTLSRPSVPLSIARSVVGRNRANIVVPMGKASAAHRLRDPETGEELIAVTAPPPARGMLKEQSFLELRALASAQGVAVQPLADDVQTAIKPDSVTFTRPGGFALSATGAPAQQLSGVAATFDPQTWGFDRNAPFLAREAELIHAAADAPAAKRWDARLNLARFYLARDMAVEAKAVLDVALSEPHSKEDVTGSILRALSTIDLQRPAEALKDLSSPQIGKQQNANVWRAVALARTGKWAAARDGFKDIDSALAMLPVELQRVVLMEAFRAAIETRDAASASKFAEELQGIGIPPALQADADVLAGRYDEQLGRKQDALAKYRAAASSMNTRAASQGRLRELALRLSMNDVARKDALNGLETLTAVWRGDETETEGLRLLARLYREDRRYRDAFHAMRVALLAHPDSDMTRQIQDESAAAFQALFLDGKGDTLPAVEALGLFYDYRELTPIGRLGDEMIRKLADRLIGVDLLDQAAELLQHQVDNRLHGAARAQVAAKLATVYLMNHKAEQALAALKATRDSDVSNELREQRLLLEARALSELGRHPLALEIVSSLNSREALRLRADVLWSAKRWREAAEAIEKLYGERWRDFKPLAESERADILRAAIGYAMADEALSLQRLREKYSAKMAEGPDARAFEVVSSPIGTSGAEFQDVARRIGTVDTLTGFLSDIRARYDGDKKHAASGAKEDGSSGPQAAPAVPQPPAGGVPLRPDPLPTGSVNKRS